VTEAAEVQTRQALAKVKNVRMSPRKVRIVVDLIRGKDVEEALAILRFLPKRAAEVISKVVKSAAANAEHNLELNRDRLYVSQAFVDAGPTLKRFHPRQRGQAFEIKKRSSHITVVVREREGGK
jgi:large subunit ribosomal protein L22